MEEYFLGDIREVRYHHYYISYEYIMTRGFCKITDKDLPSYSKSCDYISTQLAYAILTNKQNS